MEDSLFMIQRQIMQYVDDIKHHDDIKPEEIPNIVSISLNWRNF